MKRVLLALVVIAIGGCASSHVIVGKVRPEISIDQVRVYLTPPAKYEEIALLEASSKNSFAITDQGKTNKAINRMKQEAAKLGANGLLLRGTGTEHTASVNTATATSPTAATSYSIPVMHKAASGIAIYVEE